MGIKAVISDIDGTLVQYRPDLANHEEADALIPQTAIEAIRLLHQKGVLVAGVTGRTYEQSRGVLEALGITGPCVFAGGATIRNLPEGTILHESSIPALTAEEVIAIIRSELGANHPMDLEVSELDNTLYNSVWVVSKKDHIGSLLTQLLLVKDIYAVVNDGAGHHDESGLLVLNQGSDKGSATRRLLTLLGVDRSETACIGDGANDVLMFEECGLTIAMGNGEDILKNNADHVVAPIDQDGFAEAIGIILSR